MSSSQQNSALSCVKNPFGFNLLDSAILYSVFRRQMLAAAFQLYLSLLSTEAGRRVWH